MCLLIIQLQQRSAREQAPASGPRPIRSLPPLHYLEAELDKPYSVYERFKHCLIIVLQISDSSLTLSNIQSVQFSNYFTNYISIFMVYLKLSLTKVSL